MAAIIVSIASTISSICYTAQIAIVMMVIVVMLFCCCGDKTCMRWIRFAWVTDVTIYLRYV